MTRTVPIIATLIAACVAPAQGGEIDQATKNYLERIWIVGKEPDSGPCISHRYSQTQYEFEFGKTGGRLLIFEPPDLFTAISTQQIERDDDFLIVLAQTREGKSVFFVRIRLLPPDRLEILPIDDSGKSSGTSYIAYRCGDPDLKVNSSVPMEQLGVLTPALTGSQGFHEVQPDVSDTDLCHGRGIDPKKMFYMRSLQFELLGPVHYWVLGQGFGAEHSMAFDFVRSVHRIDAHTLKLKMQEHLHAGDGWDVAESHGKEYELTVIDKDSRIEIPELSATFVRCKANEPGSVGMHRW